MIHYCQLIYLKTLEICGLKYRNLILQNVFSTPGLAWQAALKKTKEKLDQLTNSYMFLMVEEGMRGGICQSIY